MTTIIRLLLIILAFSAPAYAQTPEQAAKTHFEQGRAFTAAGKLADAYKEFEAGYAILPRPAFLFNMGEAARAMGDWQKARAAYDKFLTVEATGQVADTARQRIADIDKEHPPAPATPPVAPAPVAPAAPAPVEPAKLPTPQQAADAHAGRAVDSTNAPIPQQNDGAKPIWKKWPFWAAVGGVVVTGIIIGAVVASGDDGPDCNAGCIDLR